MGLSWAMPSILPMIVTLKARMYGIKLIIRDPSAIVAARRLQ